MTVNLRWNPTVHAVKQLKERCGVEEENAKNFVNQLMENAKYVTTNPSGALVYKHAKRDIMLVVNAEQNVVITIHSATKTEKGAPTDIKTAAAITVDRIASALKRELRLFTTQLQREVNRLSEQQAELNVRIAELARNKVRCKAPHTRELIQSRIDEVSTHVTELAKEIDAKLTQIQTASEEVKAVVGE